MSVKKRLLIPDEQLAMDIEPAPPKKPNKPRAKRVDSLEERVTRLEGEFTLVKCQLEQDEDDD